MVPLTKRAHDHSCNTCIKVDKTRVELVLLECKTSVFPLSLLAQDGRNNSYLQAGVSPISQVLLGGLEPPTSFL